MLQQAPGLLVGTTCTVTLLVSGVAFRSLLIPIRLLVTIVVTVIFAMGVTAWTYQVSATDARRALVLGALSSTLDPLHKPFPHTLDVFPPRPSTPVHARPRPSTPVHGSPHTSDPLPHTPFLRTPLRECRS